MSDGAGRAAIGLREKMRACDKHGGLAKRGGSWERAPPLSLMLVGLMGRSRDGLAICRGAKRAPVIAYSPASRADE